MWLSKSGHFSLGFGIILTIVGTTVIISRLDDAVMDKILATTLPLLNDTIKYNSWKSTVLEFRVYLFHVVNPKEVQEKGDKAILAERGPYVYDELLVKTPITVNESADTIEYTAKRAFTFNATKSGTLSETDEVTVLNAAYLGSILMLESQMPALVPQFGNSIPLLFSDPSSIFLRARVKDLLFDGVRIVCDPKAHRELNLICNVLKNNRPPTLRKTSEEGVYVFSFFHKNNATDEGPLTISRGVTDRYSAGHISAFKGLPYADYWNTKNCSAIHGSDSIFWSPLSKREPEVFTFLIDSCRSLSAEYYGEKLCNGLLGYHYRISNNLWINDNSECYCPRLKNGTITCLPRGTMDVSKCQEVPVILSEPHFLHGDSSLFSTVEGLNPIDDKHVTYLVIDPLTGVPLSGFKKIQLNMMLQQQPVDLLANVSKAIFPFLWLEEGSTPDQKSLEPVIFLHRIRRLLRFSVPLPLILGLFYLMYFFWMNPGAMECLSYALRRITVVIPIENTLRN